MADVRAAKRTARSELEHLMREIRRISNRVADDFVEIDNASGKEGQEIVDVYDAVEEEAEAEVTPPSPPPPPKRPHRLVLRRASKRQRRCGSCEKGKAGSGHVVKTATRRCRRWSVCAKAGEACVHMHDVYCLPLNISFERLVTYT